MRSGCRLSARRISARRADVDTGIDQPLHRPIVFLGPSLSLDEAGRILDADYRPPLRAGDLDPIVSGTVVGIVDGLLDEKSRLAATEAQCAMKRGVRLFGAASTGALLAVRLEAIGFVGIGEVFAFLKRYQGNREELVISLYAEHDNTALTVPLINAVLALTQLGHDESAALAASLCHLPLENRTWDRIENHIDRLLGMNVDPAQRKYKNAKSNDARSLLRYLRSQMAFGTERSGQKVRR